MAQTEGLLERLHSQIGCEYLSDLRQREDCNRKAKAYMMELRATDYPVWQWRDAVQYLYGAEPDLCTYADVDEWRNRIPNGFRIVAKTREVLMISIYRGNDMSKPETMEKDEKNLLEFVSKIEKAAQTAPALLVDGEEKIQVSRDELLTLCAAAGVAYESQDWYERENQLLERICRECDMGQFSPETQQELKDWWKERQGDISLANVIQKRLKHWNLFHRDEMNG